MTYTAMVVGGGIAGMTCAIALEAAGSRATVYEAYDRTAENAGVYLTLAVNALDALRAVDVDVRGLGFDTPRITMTSGSGRRLGELPYGTGVETAGDGLTSRTVKRADLYSRLRDEALRRGVRFEHGRRLVGTWPSDAGVVASFADGTTAEGDLLIGADGLRSRTRELIAPDAPGARYNGLLNTGGYAAGITVDSEPGMMNAIFGRRCFFAYTPHPDGEVWWVANPPSPVEPTPAELAAITPEQWRRRLVDLFRDDKGPAADIIGATERIFAGWNTYDVPSVPAWHKGRMIIVGDAAHATAPSIGQGAAMAIEDAVVLAKCLRDLPTVESAFVAYEGLRRERVERVVEQGRRTGGWKAVHPLAAVPRDLVMRLGMAHMARTGNDPSRWIYEHHIDWNEPVGAVPA
ncbi:FAD-dependent monooxygenase [Promicromonospora sukumoe]|uniref:2-polyprenyl-6-methoxyphenol hydroxylase-like FAD-dependent oxidoreductase n=1 Tax=Promicromonospora sukumoe TaxID=88382 RepID=A0A7W3J7E7_9MICO|nr:FAD-dependent monooxygenase [Promicromonospora sukumoe]MBA8807529.1 2-polyprenyl-6-methoxyphenol hydroxylase-like FAD-dependent oxidoreductase [Promicromonospora sukumoe]